VKIERYWANADKLEELPASAPSRALPKRTIVRPNRWAAEPAGDRPYGPRPYEIKQAQALASGVITATIRITETQSLRDLAAHLRERGLVSGAAFQDGHSSVAEHARGIQWAITDEIEQYRRHDQLRWFLDGFVDDGALSAKEKADDLESNIPHGTDSQIAAFAGFEFQELDITIEERRAKYCRPLRPRQKPGCNPQGECAMTGAERVRNHRARKKSA
jgi:hypothetical protein